VAVPQAASVPDNTESGQPGPADGVTLDDAAFSPPSQWLWNFDTKTCRYNFKHTQSRKVQLQVVVVA
jgi:hypothetical protein